MKLVRVAAAVVNQTPFDWDGNRRRIVDALGKAREQKASVVCFPELCIPGYGCEDAFYSRDVLVMSYQVLKEILPETGGLIVSLGLPVLYHNAIFNTACLVADGQILGFVAKRYLAGDGIHYEPRWFKPWENDARSEVVFGEERHPIGDLMFDCGGVLIGYEICEDAWVADRPGAGLARQGVDLILNPSASHFAFSKIDVRKRFVLEGSRAFNATYVYANLLGNESGRSIFDGGALIATGGEIVAQGPRFSFQDSLVTTATVDVTLTRMAQARTSSFRPDLENEPGRIRVPFPFPALEPVTTTSRAEAWENSPDIKMEELTRALTLALFDYMRKSRSKGFVVSLSGGADSSACACLAALMVERCVAEIGLEGFRGKLLHFPELRGLTSVRDVMTKVLTTVYQSTKNSGDVTKNAARVIAQAVSSKHHEIDVEGIVQRYITRVQEALGRELSWETDDVALQNIQARTRGPAAWMLANIEGKLLLATSNRSEVAVGYATMDGDTCGSISPIAGIDKTFLRRWLRWLEMAGPAGLSKIPALAAVNAQPPTAELRPATSKQTDEGDLMPYPVLDAIERSFIRDKRAPLEVLRVVRTRFPEHDDATLTTYVERFVRLFCRNQWKRERYAPSFHLDDSNLDPRTWCRFPILSAGYERELREMRQVVDSGGLPPRP
ncbi:MAG: NAD(+) synthase [Acidobacteria bacterium]|nr:NAD(+) synthase [Acidobacteriota bacterium]